jgi:hypothetical protein
VIRIRTADKKTLRMERRRRASCAHCAPHKKRNCIVFHLLVTAIFPFNRKDATVITAHYSSSCPKQGGTIVTAAKKKKRKMKSLPANNGPSAIGKRIVRISGPVAEKTTAGDAHCGRFMKNDDRGQLDRKGVGRTGNCGQTRAQPVEQIKANQRQSRTQRHE